MSELLYHDKIRHATWLELFFDLIFVVLISKVTHLLAHVHHGHITLDSAIKFPLLFIPVWWIWANHTIYNNIYDSNNRPQKLMTLFIMLMMIGLSIFIDTDFEKAFVGFITFFSIIRASIGILYLKFSDEHRECRDYSLARGKVYIFATILGLLSIFFSSSIRYWIIYLSILAEFLWGVHLENKMKHIKPHMEHLLERTGLLIIILFGESVISLVATLATISWDANNILSAISGFLWIGAAWWIYFDSFEILEESNTITKPYLILVPHLIFCMGLAIVANIIRHAVLEDLTHDNFKLLFISGMFLFYIGKQLPYSIAFPKLLRLQLLNVGTALTLTLACLFIKTNTWMLIVSVPILLSYILINYKFILSKDFI